LHYQTIPVYWPAVLDPLVALLTIRDYRRAVAQLLLRFRRLFVCFLPPDRGSCCQWNFSLLPFFGFKLGNLANAAASAVGTVAPVQPTNTSLPAAPSNNNSFFSKGRTTR
jgi:hypothetical protein